MSAQIILDAAARACGLSYDDVMRRCRKAELVEARHAAMLAMHRHGFTYPQIADACHLTDHTTVVHGVRKAANLERDDPGFAVVVSIAVSAACPAMKAVGAGRDWYATREAF